MRNFILVAITFSLFYANGLAQDSSGSDEQRTKTSFQIQRPWNAAYDIRSDIVMLYGYDVRGMDMSFKDRMKTWKDHGYAVQFMSGIAWGDYQDYFLGRWDGKKHKEDSQVQRNGEIIGHGYNVPYIVPSENYLTYIKSMIKKVIDAGITTIYLEEPEFWARAGYSNSFKQRWKDYYGFPWMPQHESPEATYLSNKLKYHLYYHALNEVFTYAKKYGRSQGKEIQCFVPTHSLLNYSSWQIVSPEASLASLDAVDGYIAQVWTGTSREPVYYNGKKEERVFENAFLEYGSMVSMIKPTGRKIYFLTDPIEDRARTWDDYKRNYQATFTAELLYPSVSNFEVMPWPQRIYLDKFKLEGQDKKQPIPASYATQIQVMINALNRMPASDNQVSGSHGVGVLLSNSMMFQRFPTHDSYTDPQLSNFYGMVMPLIKRGVPVEMVHMENLGYPASLSDIKVLILSYANMKPMSPEVHKYLSEWVKQGGTMLYYGRDDDPFQQVKEWWNSNGNDYNVPSQDLFKRLGIEGVHPEGHYSFGKGDVYITRKDPKELVLQPGQESDFVDLVKQTYRLRGSDLQTKNSFYLERGPYDIVSVMDESVSGKSYRVEGPVIDLFDPNLPVVDEKQVKPGEQAFFYDLNRVDNASVPQVLAAAARVSKQERSEHRYTFTAKSPSGTQNVMRVLLPEHPKSIKVYNADQSMANEATYNWDQRSHTVLIRFENSAAGKRVKIEW